MPQNVQTALVTGASSGIGVHFAHELARRGFNVVLSARRVERLEELRGTLQRDYGVRVDFVTADLAASDGANVLFDGVRDLGHCISLLVNNAGMGKFGPTLEQTPQDSLRMIQVNVASLTVLAQLFAADMASRGGGYILNHASFSAIQPAPHYAVYSATKAYVLAFSQALRQDLWERGVRVSALCPGFFRSDFLELAGQSPSFLVRCLTLEPRRVARAGIAGVLRGKTVIIPGLTYKALNLLTRFVPRAVATGIADFAVKH